MERYFGLGWDATAKQFILIYVARMDGLPRWNTYGLVYHIYRIDTVYI